MTHTILRLVPAAVALVLVGGIAPAETLLPKFDPDRFVEGQAIDNKYFPLEPGRRAVLRAKGVEDGERVRERSVLTVLEDPGPRILGVRTVTQLDKAYEDGLLVEKTRDYFAQDKRGNVWYMGEDVTNFHYDDNGNLIRKDHESEWRAGTVEHAQHALLVEDLAVLDASGAQHRAASRLQREVLVVDRLARHEAVGVELRQQRPGAGRPGGERQRERGREEAGDCTRHSGLLASAVARVSAPSRCG